jgi:hypothetical protein
MTTATRPTCEYRLASSTAGPYGPIHRTCGQVVGVRTWTDSAGIVHAACAQHESALRHRSPAITESELRALHGDR